MHLIKIYQNLNQDQNCDFHGHASSEWLGDVQLRIPMTPTETIEIDFGKGQQKKEECQTAAANMFITMQRPTF